MTPTVNTVVSAALLVVVVGVLIVAAAAEAAEKWQQHDRINNMSINININSKKV